VAAGLETFDSSKHEWLLRLGCAGSFDAAYQKSLRSLFDIIRTHGVTFGVLEKGRCSGDPAKTAGNEYMFRELATKNIDDLEAQGAEEILTSCPHCLKTLGDDYRRFGYDARGVHSSVMVAELTRNVTAQSVARELVAYHDSCYLGRYAGTVDEPPELLTRFGGRSR
jgi:Fe-S oxidoreductase